MERCLDPEMSVNKPFENVLCQERIQEFFQGGGIEFRHFFRRSFFPSELSNENDSRGIRGHATPEDF